MDEKKIKVTDKRMFTPDGELREEFRGATESAKESEPAREQVLSPENSSPDSEEPFPNKPPIHATSSNGEATARPEIPDLGPAAHKPEFADLVAVLAQPIAMYLGDMPLPDGKSAENLDAARLYIDMLEVLRSKTSGNLSAQERNLLDDLLYQTRLRYVQKRG